MVRVSALKYDCEKLVGECLPTHPRSPVVSDCQIFCFFFFLDKEQPPGERGWVGSGVGRWWWELAFGVR